MERLSKSGFRRYVRWRGCLRKKKYAGKGEADRAAKRCRVVEMQDKVSSYKCEFCGDWHIGHSRLS